MINTRRLKEPPTNGQLGCLTFLVALLALAGFIGGPILGFLSVWLCLFWVGHSMKSIAPRVIGDLSAVPGEQKPQAGVTTTEPSVSSYTADDPRWFEGEKGAEARFVYVDYHGEVTDRTIRNWRSDGFYVHGFCLTRRESRTFRKDRIEDWQEV